jgi:translation initiation factor 1 (eIF-1/SUI1)
MAAVETCFLKLWSGSEKEVDLQEAIDCTSKLVLKLLTLHAHREKLKDGVLEDFATLKTALDCTSGDSTPSEVTDAWESIVKKKQNKDYSGILCPFFGSASYDDVKAHVQSHLVGKAAAESRGMAVANVGRLAEKLLSSSASEVDARAFKDELRHVLAGLAEVDNASRELKLLKKLFESFVGLSGNALGTTIDMAKGIAELLTSKVDQHEAAASSKLEDLKKFGSRIQCLDAQVAIAPFFEQIFGEGKNKEDVQDVRVQLENLRQAALVVDVAVNMKVYCTHSKACVAKDCSAEDTAKHLQASMAAKGLLDNGLAEVLGPHRERMQEMMNSVVKVWNVQDAGMIAFDTVASETQEKFKHVAIVVNDSTDDFTLDAVVGNACQEIRDSMHRYMQLAAGSSTPQASRQRGDLMLHVARGIGTDSGRKALCELAAKAAEQCI